MSTRSKDLKGKADGSVAPAGASAAAGANAAPTGSTSAVAMAAGKATRSNDRSKGSTAASMSTTIATATVTASSTSSGASMSGGGNSFGMSGSSASSSSVSTTTASSSSGTASVVTKMTMAPPALGTGDATPTENAPPAPQVDKSRCALCGAEKSSSPEELMECQRCGCGFHARCANLPQTPEEGEFFCRWECFTAFRKSQEVAAKTPLGDFARLSARVQSILGEKPRRVSKQTHPSSLHQPRDRERDRSKRPLPPTGGRSRSPSPIHSIEPHGGRPSNAYERSRLDASAPRRPSPVQLQSLTSHVDLTLEDDEPVLPRSPRSRPRSAGRTVPSDIPFDGQVESRGKRPKYSMHPDDAMLNGGRRAPRDPYGAPTRRLHSPASLNGRGVYGNELGPQYGPTSSIPADVTDVDRHRGGYMPLAEMFDRRTHPHRGASGSGSSRVPSVDGERGSRPSSGRSSRPSSGRYSDRPDSFDPRMGPGSSGRPISRPPSSEHFIDGRTAPPGRGLVEDMEMSRQGHSSVTPAKYNIPWRNPAAFPAGLRERFNCQPDNVNGVFRIDLTPVFADKTMHLYQSEIDFFFRCFESADVSLVVKGMASELNQYIWAWPFILESCGSDTHFSFDHFQFRHRPGELPELEYVGELRLSMASYNAYLERYLSGSMTKDTVALEDHVAKKTIHIVAAENIIALNNLVIADHCAQLHNDLVKSFQWDVFAGGIHCLLQYLPQASRHKRFSSPILHFNFPGARGRLHDPGNGTTDQAYQVLVGSLELVIFERLEPKERDTFHRLLLASGYDPDKKSMLLDSHLRVLRDAGFAWSTVLLTDGEFIHVNKGRLHFWRVVEPEVVRGPMVNSPCVFLSWEWVYQGVSQRGISTECWFAMKNASLCTGGWAFDPRRAIVEAAKCGVAIVRTGQFLNSIAGPNAPPVLTQLAFTGGASSTIDREVIMQRQEQMVLFLESILPCMDAIVEEEFELGLVKDDGDDFRKIFDDEIMWKPVDTGLSARHPLRALDCDYECGICGLELTNIYKQCLGCTVHARRSRPNVAYKVFRICLRCHAQPEHHLFKPRALHGFYDKLCSSEGHTGLLPATRRYQAERSYFKCRCTPYVRCTYCGGCESCCCLCHTLFQTRFRYSAPEHLDHLRTDVVDVIKWHKQQLQHHAHQR